MKDNCHVLRHFEIFGMHRTGQQLREAFPFVQLPRYLLRDRDAIFGHDFRETGARYGHLRSSVGTALALAASLCRASDWIYSP